MQFLLVLPVLLVHPLVLGELGCVVTALNAKLLLLLLDLIEQLSLELGCRLCLLYFLGKVFLKMDLFLFGLLLIDVDQSELVFLLVSGARDSHSCKL